MTRGSRDITGGSRVFSWFETAMVVGVSGVAAVGLVALVAAVVGVARPLPVALVGLVGWAGLLALWWWPDRSAGADRAAGAAGVDGSDETGVSRKRGPQVRAGAVVAVALLALLSGAHNLRHSGAYVVVDRDPGIYVAGGMWVAEQGDLVVEGLGPGLDGVDGVHTWASGHSGAEADSNDLEIQGAHLFHVYLAVGAWVGGSTGMFAVPALLGGLAVAAFGWLALRLLRGWAAVVVTGALVVNLAWIYSVRSILSEPTLLLLSFSGVVMLLAAVSSATRGRLFVAGLVAATALTARVDAGVVLMLTPALAAALLVRRSRSHRAGTDGAGEGERTGPARRFGWWASGWVAPITVATVDLGWRSSNYLDHLSGQVALVAAGLAASSVVAAIILALDRWWDGAGPARDRLVGAVASVGRRLPSLAVVAAGLVLVIVAFAWFVRPELGPDRADRRGEGWRVMESIQLNEGLDPDGRRTYAERSLDRINWYTGPVAIVLGAAGAAVLAVRILRHRATPTEWAVVALVVPCLVLYAYRPSIYSDHPWMIRRYIPTAIPGILLFAGVALNRAASFSRARTGPRQLAAAGATALAAVGLIVLPALVTNPLRAATWQAGGAEGVERLCEQLGDDGTALLDEGGNTAVTLLPSVRSFCLVPAARVDPSLPPESRRAVADRVAAEADRHDRTLRVVADSREAVLDLAPRAADLRPVVILQTSMVGTTIGEVPSAVADHSVTVWVGDVVPDDR